MSGESGEDAEREVDQGIEPAERLIDGDAEGGEEDHVAGEVGEAAVEEDVGDELEFLESFSGPEHELVGGGVGEGDQFFQGLRLGRGPDADEVEAGDDDGERDEDFGEGPGAAGGDGGAVGCEGDGDDEADP